ncbi:LOW QUALITY PROTEIN: hypothetical protein ACHAW5_004573 [Stephanodiscus triporus]|uniref:Uncharacterized protein n=1 Tax=Stephanodiscus triporus TaxID=2934178 RepID=A0ABD3NXE7_9STRA
MSECTATQNEFISGRVSYLTILVGELENQTCDNGKRLQTTDRAKTLIQSTYYLIDRLTATPSAIPLDSLSATPLDSLSATPLEPLLERTSARASARASAQSSVRASIVGESVGMIVGESVGAKPVGSSVGWSSVQSSAELSVKLSAQSLAPDWADLLVQLWEAMLRSFESGCKRWQFTFEFAGLKRWHQGWRNRADDEGCYNSIISSKVKWLANFLLPKQLSKTTIDSRIQCRFLGLDNGLKRWLQRWLSCTADVSYSIIVKERNRLIIFQFAKHLLMQNN